MEILGEVTRIITRLQNQANVVFPTDQELREQAEKVGNRTEYGNFNFSTSVKSRSAGVTVHIGRPEVQLRTVNNAHQKILDNLSNTMDKISSYLQRVPLVGTKCRMCDNNEYSPECTMYVSTYRKDSIRLSYMWTRLLFEADTIPKTAISPKLNLVYLPEWQEKDRQVLVFPEIGVTFVLGSDYLGEAKKGFLRMAMWFAKAHGMLGIHAGAKMVWARAPDGSLKHYSMLFFGLSGTGKTTHSCHDHGLVGEGEGVKIVQDDMVLLNCDGSALGTERGFYLKTDIYPEHQPLIYRAVKGCEAVFENVMVDYTGKVELLDDTLTGNGRGVIQRADLGEEYITDSVNLPPLSDIDGMVIAFITRRNTIVPMASRLTAEQAAAYFMLGESIETSAGDPTRAGESVRVVGTNPFIIGSEEDEGNWFYDFLRNNSNKVQCYLLNTGGSGEIVEVDDRGCKVIKQKVTRIEIPEMASIIRNIVRGTIEWVDDPNFGTRVAREIEGVNLERFNPETYYTGGQIKEMVDRLNKERVDYLARYPGLKRKIVDSIKR
ncbi:MAG: phosphoenolpyruvate carboxykinase [ANME-2 cluster archaeon]|nr:phosphoenolpyruvate carboxykinase [ANME-2 cluster archaeon]